jgi:Flp pilus assembly protein TadD
MTTENDRAVLSRILNPLLPAEYGIDNIDENIVDDTSSDQKNDDNEQVLAAKQLEIEAIQLAESGQIDAAIDMLNRAIDQCPQRASAYNNRAQALRIKGNVDGNNCFIIFLI